MFANSVQQDDMPQLRNAIVLHLPQGDRWLRPLLTSEWLRKHLCPSVSSAKPANVPVCIQQLPHYAERSDPKKCPLWDASVEGRHSDEV